ncbi:hypothetical protein TNCV_4535311 [Trichonephila clavipes]|nr:hypothetical protein TNCV_4535311 [Trichonephila clavipes]
MVNFIILVSFKTYRLEELMHIKSVETQSPHVVIARTSHFHSGEVLKVRCRPMYRSHHLDVVKNYEVHC